MVKLYSRRHFPKILIVEGFWQIGKSELVKNLAKKLDYKIIKEPDHLTYGVKVNISEWYRKKHLEKYKMIKCLKKVEKGIVMERSIISNISFKYAITGKISKCSKKYLKRIKQLNNFLSFSFMATEALLQRKHNL